MNSKSHYYAGKKTEQKETFGYKKVQLLIVNMWGHDVDVFHGQKIILLFSNCYY